MTPAGLKKRKHRFVLLTHDEFVFFWKKYVISIYFTGDPNRYLPDSDKTTWNIIYSIYKYSPIVGGALLSYFNQNWWLLFSIPIYYLGGLTAKKKWMLLFLFFCFCCGIWMRDGFNWKQYITVFYFSMLIGYLMYKWIDGFRKNAIAEFLCFSETMYNIAIDTYGMIVIKRLSFYKKFPDFKSQRDIIEDNE